MLEIIFSDPKYIFLSGDVLQEAARMNKDVVKYLLQFKPDWIKCLAANKIASDKGYSHICDMIKPFCEAPEGLKKIKDGQ